MEYLWLVKNLDLMLGFILVICEGCEPIENKNAVDKSSLNFVTWRCSCQFYHWKKEQMKKVIDSITQIDKHSRVSKGCFHCAALLCLEQIPLPANKQGTVVLLSAAPQGWRPAGAQGRGIPGQGCSSFLATFST